MIRPFALTPANGVQTFPLVPNGLSGKQQLSIIFDVYPTAGAALVEYLPLGSSTWKTVTGASALSMTAARTVSLTADVAQYRITLSGMTGGYSGSFSVRDTGSGQGSNNELPITPVGDPLSVQGDGAIAIGNLPIDPNVSGDRSAAVQAALNAAMDDGVGKVKLDPNRALTPYQMNAGVSIDLHKTGLDGSGTVLDYSPKTAAPGVPAQSGLVSGAALYLLRNQGDINQASGLAATHEIENLYLKGPGIAGSLAVTLEPGDPAHPGWAFHQKLRGVAIVGFDCALRYDEDAWAVGFVDSVILPFVNGVEPNIHMPARAGNGGAMNNAGERSYFSNGSAINKNGTHYLGEWGNGDHHEINSSIDQHNCVYKIRAGQGLKVGGHTENKKDNYHWYSAEGQNASIIVDDHVFYVPSPADGGGVYDRTNIANSDPWCRFGGVVMGNIHISCTGTWNRQTWGYGRGRLTVERISLLDGSTARPPMSRYMSLFPDGTDSKHLDGWTPLPGVALLQAGSTFTLGIAGFQGSGATATFSGTKALTAADRGAIIQANSSGSTGMARILVVNSPTSAIVEIITPFTSADNVDYFAQFPTEAGVPTRVNGWMQPFNRGIGLEPLPGQVVTGAQSGATMTVVDVKKTGGMWANEGMCVNFTAGGVGGGAVINPGDTVSIGASTGVARLVLVTSGSWGGTTGATGHIVMDSSTNDFPVGGSLMVNGTARATSNGCGAIGQIYGFSKSATGFGPAGEAFQVGGVTFASVMGGSAATTNYAYQFGGTDGTVVKNVALTLGQTATGANVSATAASAAFAASDVGRIIRSGVGFATITAVTSSTVATVTITAAFASTAVASGAWAISVGQRLERWLDWKDAKNFAMAYVAQLTGCAAVGKALSVTVAFCDEFGQVLTNPQGVGTIGAVAGSSVDGYKTGPNSRANVTPPPPGTKRCRLRVDSSPAFNTGGVINTGDFIACAQ